MRCRAGTKFQENTLKSFFPQTSEVACFHLFFLLLEIIKQLFINRIFIITKVPQQQQKLVLWTVNHKYIIYDLHYVPRRAHKKYSKYLSEYSPPTSRVLNTTLSSYLKPPGMLVRVVDFLKVTQDKLKLEKKVSGSTEQSRYMSWEVKKGSTLTGKRKERRLKENYEQKILRRKSLQKKLAQLPAVDMRKVPGRFSLMHSHCAYCTVIMTAWLEHTEHAACQLQAVENFFCTMSADWRKDRVGDLFYIKIGFVFLVQLISEERNIAAAAASRGVTRHVTVLKSQHRYLKLPHLSLPLFIIKCLLQDHHLWLSQPVQVLASCLSHIFLKLSILPRVISCLILLNYGLLRLRDDSWHFQGSAINHVFSETLQKLFRISQSELVIKLNCIQINPKIYQSKWVDQLLSNFLCINWK
ncbi:hypothetical protein VP01_4500g1 [Puccinia sorghi]|uniref:Uncharacterized protein n=1 Tax=Puccinia sorghi TaxID=27349 RepID=A0A0L6UPX1_9BASI|nr:hypothetical protein VP01_4500g1 [Puccinia sorghi]